VLTASGAMLLTALLLLRFCPRVFLDTDGRWLLKTMAAYLPSRSS
jgi:hypothetical protein